jgi:PAS domain-containing protein
LQDGFQLIKALRADPKCSGIPVLLLSARAGDEARVEGLQAGADDYVVKPFSARELIARVNTHLELGRLRMELEARIKERTSELADSELRYKTLATLSPVGIFRTDKSGRCTYFNNRMHGIMGHPTSDADAAAYYWSRYEVDLEPWCRTLEGFRG